MGNYNVIDTDVGTIHEDIDPEPSPEPSLTKYQHGWEIDEGVNDIDEAKQADNLNDNKCSVLVLGITGSGKSSVCGLLSGRDVKTSNDVISCTKKTTAHAMVDNPNYLFIDTMGTQDCDQQYSDPQILKKALKYLHRKRITISKVIWCISSGTKTRRGPFMDQAKFISGLKIPNTDQEGKENEESSIWDSVLIVKYGKGSLKGVTEAANEFGAKDAFDDKNTFAFNCIDWIKKAEKEGKTKKAQKEGKTKEEEKDEVLATLEPLGPSILKQAGYVSSKEAKKIIMDKLNNLVFFKFRFLKQICTKCGVRGDSRYIVAPCHTTKELYHSKKTLKHYGELINYHSMGARNHDVFVMDHAHKGHRVKRHTSNKMIPYHSGEKKTVHVAKLKYKALNIFDPVWSEKDWEYWNCCKEYGLGCRLKWECCGQDESAIECTDPKAVKIWDCCDVFIASGTSETLYQIPCVQIKQKVEIELYECCNKFTDEDNNGCDQKYDCCESMGEGCREYYSCCNEFVESAKDGCQFRCAHCEVVWGTSKDGKGGGGCVRVEEN